MRPETLALDARVLQEDAFCHDSSRSLKYLLLLNGVVPSVDASSDPEQLYDCLQQATSDAFPGASGPIAVLLIL
jgi:hypothetical protein